MQKFSGWNEAKLRELKAKGKIKNYQIPAKNLKKREKNSGNRIKVSRRSAEKDWLSWNIPYWCNEHSISVETEYAFHPARRWRFDWAIPSLKIAIEYEGIVADKSRHTTISGYSGDSDKYNHAALLGWKVIRLTALNYKEVLILLNSVNERI